MSRACQRAQMAVSRRHSSDEVQQDVALAVTGGKGRATHVAHPAFPTVPPNLDSHLGPAAALTRPRPPRCICCHHHASARFIARDIYTALDTCTRKHRFTLEMRLRTSTPLQRLGNLDVRNHRPWPRPRPRQALGFAIGYRRHGALVTDCTSPSQQMLVPQDTFGLPFPSAETALNRLHLRMIESISPSSHPLRSQY